MHRCETQLPNLTREKADLILLHSNFLESLNNPKNTLTNIINNLTKPKNSLIFLSTSFDWNENITDSKNWMGGYKKDAENYFSSQGIKEFFEENEFRLIKKDRLPFEVPNGDGSSKVYQENVFVFGR